MSSRGRSQGAARDRPTAASTKTLARVAAVLFLITFVTSIPALLLYDTQPHEVDGGRRR